MTKPIISWSIALFLLLSLLPTRNFAAPVPAGTLQITGAVVKPLTLSAKTFQQQFETGIQRIAYTRKGVAHTAHAVALWTVLQSAQPRINPQIKNHQLQFVVLVRGRDGYTAAFSLPELSPDFGHRDVWVALDEDGKPFGDEAGPVEIVVPDDKKAGRWVGSVTTITLVDEAQANAAGRP